MAGDWIKMRIDLGEDPSVVLLSCETGLSEDAVVGKLHRLWSWADKHTSDGTAPAITQVWVDRYVSHSGFAAAMVKAGWLSFSESGVIFPDFQKHNGKSAKTRADAAIRQRLSRKNRDDGVTGLERGTIPKPFIRHVFERDGYTCAYCGVTSDEATEKTKNAILSVDHVVPETRGGKTAIDNLLCACRQCNMEKSDRTPEEWDNIPEFLQSGVSYENGRIVTSRSRKSCDKIVTREEKRRDNSTPNGVEGEPKRFVKPTLEEVVAYVAEKGIKLDCQKFHAHYESNGWRVGKNPMKNWKATITKWERSEHGTNQTRGGFTKPPDIGIKHTDDSQAARIRELESQYLQSTTPNLPTSQLP